jgi:hypothetical protein
MFDATGAPCYSVQKPASSLPRAHRYSCFNTPDTVRFTWHLILYTIFSFVNTIFTWRTGGGVPAAGWIKPSEFFFIFTHQTNFVVKL